MHAKAFADSVTREIGILVNDFESARSGHFNPSILAFDHSVFLQEDCSLLIAKVAAHSVEVTVAAGCYPTEAAEMASIPLRRLEQVSFDTEYCIRRLTTSAAASFFWGL